MPQAADSPKRTPATRRRRVRKPGCPDAHPAHRDDRWRRPFCASGARPRRWMASLIGDRVHACEVRILHAGRRQGIQEGGAGHPPRILVSGRDSLQGAGNACARAPAVATASRHPGRAVRSATATLPRSRRNAVWLPPRTGERRARRRRFRAGLPRSGPGPMAPQTATSDGASIAHRSDAAVWSTHQCPHRYARQAGQGHRGPGIDIESCSTATGPACSAA